MKRDTAYAKAAIERLNTVYRTGIDRFDSWIDYAIRDWERFIAEQSAAATDLTGAVATGQNLAGAVATDRKQKENSK